MIAEAIDTVLVLGWALVAWVVVLSAAGTVILLGVTAAVAWTCRTVWRSIRRPAPAPDDYEAAA
ncbi:hypothetical protein [Streptomyces rochei]|uniref:hypothetical protein n=1 Tax=Streptomyces rochei TaxID=1928 RepID=UPI0036FF5EF5